MVDAETNLRYFADDPAYRGEYEVTVPAPEDRISVLVKTHIPPGKGDCIEIGCSPGGFLTLFGELGYTLHGIDFDPRIRTELPRWLSERNFKPGEFTVADFTTHAFSRQYDVVYSLGFIEHFTNWVEIVGRHAELVKQGGWLLIGAPNYCGIVQRVLHKLLEEDNYRTHVTASMNPEVWKQILQSAGFEVSFCGTVGPFDLWTRGTERLPRAIQEFGWMVSELKPTLAALEETKSFASSSYLGIVGRRTCGTAPALMLERPEASRAIESVRREFDAMDRGLEDAAESIVGEMRRYFEHRSRMSTAIKDVVRRMVGRS